MVVRLCDKVTPTRVQEYRIVKIMTVVTVVTALTLVTGATVVTVVTVMTVLTVVTENVVMERKKPLQFFFVMKFVYS